MKKNAAKGLLILPLLWVSLLFSPAFAEADAKEELQSALADASYYGNAEEVERLLRAGAGADKPGVFGFRPEHPLYLAIISPAGEDSREKIVDLLLRRGAKPRKFHMLGAEARFRCNYAIMEMLVRHGATGAYASNALSEVMWGGAPDIRLCAFLFGAGADVNSTAWPGEITPFMFALQNESIARVLPGDDTDVLSLLLEKGPTHGLTDEDGDTYLHHALKGIAPDPRVLQRVLPLEPDIGKRRAGGRGENALEIAVRKGLNEHVALLMKAGRPDGREIFRLLGVSGNVETARNLLQGEVDLKAESRRPTKDPWGHDESVPRYYRALCLENAEELLPDLVRRGFDPSDSAALQQAASCAKSPETILPALLRYGDAVRIRDADGRTSLMRAAEEGDARTVRLLFEAGAGLEDADPQGKTALFYAARGQDSSTLAALLELGADARHIDHSGRTALFDVREAPGRRPVEEAAENDRLTETRLSILLRAGTPLDHQDANGDTAFMHALGQGILKDQVAEFLQARPGIGLRNKWGKQLIHSFCANMDDADPLESLLALGADPNASDDRGMTPLMYAAGPKVVDHGMEKFVARLVKAGADVNAKDRNGNTALMHASLHAVYDEATDFHKALLAIPAHVGPGIEAVRALLGNGADVMQRNRDGDTVLHLLLRNHPSYCGTCSVLLEAGADPNARNGKGRTPLMLAAEHATIEKTVSILAAHGGDKTLRDDEGKSAEDYAGQNPRISVRYIRW